MCDVLQSVERAVLESVNRVSSDDQADRVARDRRGDSEQRGRRAAHRMFNIRTLAARRTQSDG